MRNNSRHLRFFPVAFFFIPLSLFAGGVGASGGQPSPAAITTIVRDAKESTKDAAGETLVRDARELVKAVAAARPGDAVVLCEGTWTDVKLSISARGDPGRPVFIRAQRPGETVLTGNSGLRISGNNVVVEGLFFRGVTSREDIVRIDGDHCRLTQCAIIDSNPPVQSGQTKWVHLFGLDNRVDHCHFAEKSGEGVVLQVEVGDRPNNHMIDHNYFGHRPPLGRNGAETVRIGYSFQSMLASRTTVESNLFERCDGEIEIISSKSCENSFIHNTFLNSQGCLTLRHGNRCLVAGNFFLGGGTSGTGGVRVIGEGHRIINNYLSGLGGRAGGAIVLVAGIPNSPLAGYFQVKDCLIAFNTIIGCKGPCLLLNSNTDARTRLSGRTASPSQTTSS